VKPQKYPLSDVAAGKRGVWHTKKDDVIYQKKEKRHRRGISLGLRGERSVIRRAGRGGTGPYSKCAGGDF